MFEMKDEYYTGIQFVDEEHTRLFEIAEEIYQVKQNDFIVDKYDNVKKILDELTDYTKYHFNHEEEYMKEIGYKKLFTQKVEHDFFIKKLEEFGDNHFDDNSEEIIDNLLNFVSKWLVNHIMENDKQIPAN